MKNLKSASIGLALAMFAAGAMGQTAHAGFISSFLSSTGPGTVGGSTVPGTNVGEGFDDGNNLAAIQSARAISVTETINPAPLGTPFTLIFGTTDTAANPFPGFINAASGNPPAGLGQITEHTFTVNASLAQASPLYTFRIGYISTAAGNPFVPSAALDNLGFDIPDGTPIPGGTAPVLSRTEDVLTYGPVSGGVESFQFSVDVPNALTNVNGPGFFPAGVFTDRIAIQQIQAVPEPSTYAMFAIGLLGMVWFSRRRKQPGQAVSVAGLS